jgi:membrane-bound lytic murein transglycosylase D
MLKYILFLSLVFSSQIHAEKFKLKFNDKSEIEILKSLDINETFACDTQYLKTKKEISEVKVLFFHRSIEKGKVFVSTLSKMLKEENIPNTFLYLAMVESKFLADAKSHKSAAGLWQLMPTIAKKYNLTINNKIDERLDPVKSTKAAIEYLKYLHKRFKKWYLVAIAYNAGETRLSILLKKLKMDDLAILIDPDSNYLPKETRNYIRRFISTALLADTALKVDQFSDDNNSNIALEEIKAKKGESLKAIAEKFDLPLASMKKFNPHILKGILPKGKKRFCVYIPNDKLKKTNKICSNKDIFIYTIKSGDTLSKLSKKYNNKLSAIKELNKDLGHVLKIGQEIALIGDLNNTKVVKKKKKIIKDKKQIVKKEKAKERKKSIFIYTTTGEDTIFKISKKFNNKIATIRELNKDLPIIIKEGIKIKVIHTPK